ncbi:uncharacterized protein [Apostichopus japonicus]|uniref:uncharacterized protein n=1 Tax=Stichopus japonicus TaxID=307972 RepID=UPI003AB22778
MFFTFSLASYYASSYMARKFTKFLAYGRAQYILPEGCYGYRPRFQDLKRKPFTREFPVTEENVSSLLCFPSEQTLRMREDLFNSKCNHLFLYIMNTNFHVKAHSQVSHYEKNICVR